MPDLLGRDFTADKPNQHYVGDITYLPIADGTNLYLATVTDCHSRRLTGWAIAEHMRTDLIWRAPAHLRAGGKLQMPALVMAAGPAPERDPRAGQPQVLGVEVHGRQTELCRFPRWSCSPLRGPCRRRRQCHDKVDVDRLA